MRCLDRDAPISADEDAAKVRIGSCVSPQPLFPGTPPRRSPNLQISPSGRLGRVAVADGLSSGLPSRRSRPVETGSHPTDSNVRRTDVGRRTGALPGKVIRSGQDTRARSPAQLALPPRLRPGRGRRCRVRPAITCDEMFLPVHLVQRHGLAIQPGLRTRRSPAR